MTYCFLYAAIERYATSPPPSRLRRQKNQCALSRIGFDRSVPRTLRPPWQGGPRGLSNFATKCNLLPLSKEEARGSASLQPTATIPTKSSIHQPNFDASETERPCTTTVRVQGLTKAKYRTDASAHKQGVQGGTPWAFSVPFCAQKGTPRRIGGPSGEDTP